MKWLINSVLESDELIKFKQFYCKFSWNLKIIIIVLLFLEKMYNFSAPLKNVCYNFLN